MDHQCSLQDVIRCHICDTPVPSKHCATCHINLCIICMEEHLNEHCIVPFEMRGITPKCSQHSKHICKLHCQQCNIPICSLCVSSGEHELHKKENILETMTRLRELMKKDLRELENSIRSKYKEAESQIPNRRTKVKEHSRNLTTALEKQGIALHNEIDTNIQTMKSEIEVQHLIAVDKEEEIIRDTITDIEKVIQELRNLMDSDDACLVSKYRSRNEEFRNLLAQFKVILPTFTPREISREKIYQDIGTLSKLVITSPAGTRIDEQAIITEEHGGLMKTPEAASSPPARQLIDDPRILTDIQTEYGMSTLHSVSILSDNEVWTCGDRNKTMRLYNLQGGLVKSVQTKSGNYPRDIAITLGEDLVYTDYDERSINIVKNTRIQTLFTLWGWRPRGVCSTSSGDLLVIIDSDNEHQTKVMRYSSSKEKQCIQWDDKNKSLYSHHGCNYVNENRNQDICVTDCVARAVVVVNAAGKLRFRYNGPSKIKELFYPLGITTDSQSKILTADYNNRCIHIIDQDGFFLRYIENCDLGFPYGLCVDSRDNLFVAKWNTGKLRKIQYYD